MIRFIQSTVLVVAFVFICVVHSAHATNNATATATPTPQLASKQTICKTCKCDAQNALIDCSAQKLNVTFPAELWAPIAATGTNKTRVTFAGNGIQTVTAFPRLNITHLDLSDNRIAVILPNAFRNLSATLVELDLSANLLTYQSLRPDAFIGKYAPDAYEPLRELRILRLAHNRLHELDQDLFEHLPALETLTLNGNSFRTIGYGANVAISRVPYLRELDLSNMELRELPEHLLHTLNRLKVLHLGGNLFESLPTALGYAQSVEYLNLDENPLGNLTGDNVFPAMLNLRALGLSYMMRLKSIDRGAFSALANLTTFNCTNNPHLGHIDGAAFSRAGRITNATTEEWPVVAELRLHNNNLRILDSHLLARWDTVHVLELETNPWQCDCENQWLLDVVVPLLVNRTGFRRHHLLCDEPIELVGEELVALKEHETKMRCLDVYGNRPERDGPYLVGILMGLLLGIPLTLAVLMLWRRGCFGLVQRTPPGAAHYSRAFYKRAEMQDTDLRVHI